MKMRAVLEEEKKDVRFGTWSSGDVRRKEGVREEGCEGGRERGRERGREGSEVVREGGRRGVRGLVRDSEREDREA